MSSSSPAPDNALSAQLAAHVPHGDSDPPPEVALRNAITGIAAEIGLTAVELAGAFAAPDLAGTLARVAEERDIVANNVSNVCYEFAELLDIMDGDGDPTPLNRLLGNFRYVPTSLREQVSILEAALNRELAGRNGSDAREAQ